MTLGEKCSKFKSESIVTVKRCFSSVCRFGCATCVAYIFLFPQPGKIKTEHKIACSEYVLFEFIY